MHDQTIDQMNRIIQTNIDRREGYEKAIEQTEDPQLKDLFRDCQTQSEGYLNELREIAGSSGAETVSTTSTAGDLYRVWMDIKQALSVNNTKAVLQSCERGEDVALNAYRQATDPEATNAVTEDTLLSTLNKQKDGILVMHNRVKALRDAQ